MTPEQTERRAKMLAHIRDVLTKKAAGERSWYDLAAERNTEWEPDDKERTKMALVAMEAAADIFAHLHAEWLETSRTERGVPAWLVKISDQAAAAFKTEFSR